MLPEQSVTWLSTEAEMMAWGEAHATICKMFFKKAYLIFFLPVGFWLVAVSEHLLASEPQVSP